MSVRRTDGSGYRYIYLISALICIFLALTLSISLIFGNFFSEDAGGSVVSDQDLSGYPATSDQESEPEGTDSSSPSQIEFKEIVVQEGSLSAGSLILIGSSAPESGEINLKNIYHRDNKYSLSTTKLTLEEEALAAFNKMMNDFSQATSAENVMVANAYTPVSDITKDTSIAEYSDFASGRTLRLTVYPSSKGKIYEGVYLWITDHCTDYGFILRYPEGKEAQTGADAHVGIFRYVGLAHSKYISQNSLSLEEYIELVKTHSSDNPLAVTDFAGAQHFVYYTAAEPGGSTALKIPDTGAYTVSGDNKSGYIVTVPLD